MNAPVDPLFACCGEGFLTSGGIIRLHGTNCPFRRRMIAMHRMEMLMQLAYIERTAQLRGFTKYADDRYTFVLHELTRRSGR